MAKTRAAHGSSARKNEALMNPEETEQIHPQTETAPTEAANQQALDVVTATSPLAKPETDPDEEVQIALQNLEKRRAEKKRKKRQQLIGIGAAALALVAGIAGWRLLSAGSAEEEVAPEYATVERGNYEDDITGSGTLKAGSTVAVTPEVDGIIESVLVTEGQQVNEGDLLFTLKNDSLDKAVRDAAQEVQTAQQGVASAQRGVEFAAASRDDAWNRYYSAWNEADAKHREWEYAINNYSADHAAWEQRKNYAESIRPAVVEDPGVAPAVPEDDPLYKDWYQRKQKYYTYQTDLAAYETAAAAVGVEPQPAGVEPTYPEAPDDNSLLSAVQSAQDSVTSANATLTKANEAYEEAVKNAEKRQVKAPASGNVVALGAKVGQAVGSATGAASAADAKSTTPLVQISDVNKMSVDIEVNEIDILNIKRGQSAVVTFSAVPDVECKAQVTEVATVASSTGEGGVVTFHVGLVIPKPDKKLREGMTANVKIVVADANDVLLVPAAAVTETGAGATVQVVTNEETNETETREVKVGLKNSNTAVIEEGLKEGETILVSAGSADVE